MSVTEYRDRFLQLARYAPADVADDRKKQEHFMEGLEDYLQYALSTRWLKSSKQRLSSAY